MFISVLLFYSVLAQPPVVDPVLPWLSKSPEELEILIDSLADQPPYFI